MYIKFRKPRAEHISKYKGIAAGDLIPRRRNNGVFGQSIDPGSTQIIDYERVLFKRTVIVIQYIEQ